MNPEENDTGPPLLLRPEKKLGGVIYHPGRIQGLGSVPENLTLIYLDYEV